VSHEDVTLAVLLRQTQWLLDDVAHDLPPGRVTPDKARSWLGSWSLLPRSSGSRPGE
jgi:hypothetical protein